MWVGTYDDPSNSEFATLAEVKAVYPGGSFYSVLPTQNYGWIYDPAASVTSNTTRVTIRQHDPWSNIAPSFESAIGELHRDVSILAGGRAFPMNTSIVTANATYRVNYTNSEGWMAKPPIGTLGLAPLATYMHPSFSMEQFAPGCLKQLQDAGLASSQSFSLNMGSVTCGPSGSLYYGGYEKNRVLGDVAVLNLDNMQTPKVFLFDVTLGVETGGSPFNQTGQDNIGGLSGRSWSIWNGFGDDMGDARRLTEYHGGPSGSIYVKINPAMPYIYLPSSLCQAVAEYLPLRWREDVELFVWDTDDDQFERIIKSPAYMGFVFADRDRNNVTVKVPFALLNLTLTEPLIDDGPVRYFPCKSYDEGYEGWDLGRAFLQAAFFGINYDNEIAYLAQGPGPDLDQSVLRYFADFDGQIETDPAEAFEKTWRNTWTVLEDDSSAESGSGSDTGPGPEPEPEPEQEETPGQEDSPSSGLSAGVIAGAVVGPVVGLGLLGAAVFLWKRRRDSKMKSGSESTLPDGSASLKTATIYVEGPGMQEMPGHGMRQELETPVKTHEVPTVEVRHELQ